MKKVKMIVLAITTALFVLTPLTISAAPATSKSITETNNGETSSTYTKDVIEYIYRYNTEGVLQYRRWNSTKGVWVDPAWIDVD